MAGDADRIFTSFTLVFMIRETNYGVYESHTPIYLLPLRPLRKRGSFMPCGANL